MHTFNPFPPFQGLNPRNVPPCTTTTRLPRIPVTTLAIHTEVPTTVMGAMVQPPSRSKRVRSTFRSRRSGRGMPLLHLAAFAGLCSLVAGIPAAQLSRISLVSGQGNPSIVAAAHRPVAGRRERSKSGPPPSIPVAPTRAAAINLLSRRWTEPPSAKSKCSPDGVYALSQCKSQVLLWRLGLR